MPSPPLFACSPDDSFAWIPGSTACVRCVRGIPETCTGSGCSSDSSSSPGAQAGLLPASASLQLHQPAGSSHAHQRFSAWHTRPNCCACLSSASCLLAGAHVVSVGQLACSGGTMAGSYEVKAVTKCSSWPTASPTLQLGIAVAAVSGRCMAVLCGVLSLPAGRRRACQVHRVLRGAFNCAGQWQLCCSGAFFLQWAPVPHRTANHKLLPCPHAAGLHCRHSAHL